VEQTTETENLAHRVLAALTAPTHKESQSPATTPDRERDGATTNFENTLRQLVEDIVCAGSNCPKKKIGPFGRTKSHPYPKVFSWQGSARNFLTVEKQRFFMFLKNQPFLQKNTPNGRFPIERGLQFENGPRFPFLKSTT